MCVKHTICFNQIDDDDGGCGDGRGQPKQTEIKEDNRSNKTRHFLTRKMLSRCCYCALHLIIHSSLAIEYEKLRRIRSQPHQAEIFNSIQTPNGNKMESNNRNCGMEMMRWEDIKHALVCDATRQMKLM